jgi:hypothetical protein
MCSVSQALILIDYLLRNGSARFVDDCKHRAREFQKLTRYKHYDQNNEDDAKEGLHCIHQLPVRSRCYPRFSAQQGQGPVRAAC